MITMKDFMEVVDYRITDCTKYFWECFGSNAHSLDFWDGSHTGKSAHVIFDTESKTIFQMEVYDFAVDKAVRWTNPDYKELYFKEANSRDCDPIQAYDDVNFVDLDEEEFLKTAYATLQGK